MSYSVIMMQLENSRYVQADRLDQTFQSPEEAFAFGRHQVENRPRENEKLGFQICGPDAAPIYTVAAGTFTNG